MMHGRKNTKKNNEYVNWHLLSIYNTSMTIIRQTFDILPQETKKV